MDLNHFDTSLRYEIIDLIAEGGMGSVYKAQQLGADGFKKVVAIKMIKKEFSQIPEFRSNFIGEAKLVSDLIHTNIVQIYHLGEMNGQYYMVMEYVNGISLEEFFVLHLERRQSLPLDLCVFLVSRLCRGLAYAHRKHNKDGELIGIVHRDVNPKNLLISYEGDVKLTDFGIAKARALMYNKEGEVIAGKDDYLSPEQAQKQVTDARADIFSCGVILLELLLGYNIFSGDTLEQTHTNIIEGVVPDISTLDDRVDADLNTIIQKMLAKDRKTRYQDTAELLTDLELYLYKDGYGPTNEKLSEYMMEILGGEEAIAREKWSEKVRSGLTYHGFLD